MGSTSGTYCHAVREDGKKKGLLYLGTEHGVMYSPDAGKTWKSLQQNLPTVPVHDLVVKGDDLVVGTHGRSIWILDDLTPLRQTTERDPQQDRASVPGPARDAAGADLGAPTTGFTRQARTVRTRRPGRRSGSSSAKDFKGEAKIEILDAKGTVIAKASGKFGDKPADCNQRKRMMTSTAPKPRKLEPKPGLNRFVWDLTHDGATPIPGAAG